MTKVVFLGAIEKESKLEGKGDQELKRTEIGPGTLEKACRETDGCRE